MAGYHQQVFKHDTGTDYLVFSLAQNWVPTEWGKDWKSFESPCLAP